MSVAVLRRRAPPVGLALGLISLTGVVVDIVATSQILVLGGADSLLVLYPISGVGLAWWGKVYRDWDASMLHWRLRRRKRSSLPGLEGL